MERRFGRYAIPNLMYYIILLYVMGFVIFLVNPMIYWQYFSLNPAAILRGQIWRLITFMMYPPTTSLIFFVFVLLLYYSLGRTLERIWGAFRFNVYIFMGILGHVIAAFVLYAVYGMGAPMLTPTYLNASVFMAYAMTFPEDVFYIYFVFAVKAKWLAVFEGAAFLLSFVFGNAATRLEIVLSLANFLIFFLLTRNYNRIRPSQVKRRKEFKAQTIRPQSRARHVCAVCGRTSEDSPGMEFRYCSKCEGNYEYCMDHLYTHQHVKKTDASSH